VQDLAVANSGAVDASGVSVFLGNGDGSFQQGRHFRAGHYGTHSIVAGDFNGDGHLDLAVANSGAINVNGVSVFLGNGDGSFQAAWNFDAGRSPWSISVGDFNGDGVQDLAVANMLSNNASVLLGNGDGSFQPTRHFGVGKGPRSVAVGDFNGDGRLDLAAANSGPFAVSVLINDTPR
jgi:hypothetical protein